MKSRNEVCAEVVRSYANSWVFVQKAPMRKGYFEWKKQWWDAIWDEFPDVMQKEGYINVRHVHTDTLALGIRNRANPVQPARPG